MDLNREQHGIGEDEKVYILVRQSTWMFVYYLLILIIGGVFIVPIFYALRGLSYNMSTFYIFEDDSMSETHGLFSPVTNDIQYYRIKSVRLKRPFLMRFFGLGTVEIITSEQFAKTIIIPGISEYDWIYSGLQQMSEDARQKRGVGEQNFYLMNNDN